MNGQELRKLLCSMLIGDASMSMSGGYKGNNKCTYFSFTHSIKQEDYCKWKESLINNFFVDHNIDKRMKFRYYDAVCKEKKYPAIQCYLGWKKFETLLRKAYSSNGNKKNFCYLLGEADLDLHLAIWIGDDGNEDRSYTKSKTNKEIRYPRSPRYRLSIYSFTDGEANLAVKWFEYRFNMTPAISKQKAGPVLRFTVRDSKKLFDIIRPYFSQIPSMKYKFRWSFEKYCLKEERSTSELNSDEDTVQSA